MVYTKVYYIVLEEGDDLENWTFRMLASSVLL